MVDAAVFVATVAAIFGPWALVFVLAVRDFRRRARAAQVPGGARSDGAVSFCIKSLVRPIDMT